MANGESTSYLKNTLNLAPLYGAIGVKNLHPIAHGFDIGLYTESNGHGTFIINPSIVLMLEKLASSAKVKNILITKLTSK